MLLKMITGSYLAGCTLYDLKGRTIPCWLLCAGSAASVLYFAVSRTPWRDPAVCCEGFLALLPGVFLILIAFLTRGGIGYGDGVVFLGLGLLTGAGMCTILLMGSLLTASVWCGALLLLKRAGRKTRIPFIPVILLTWLLTAVFVEIL